MAGQFGKLKQHVFFWAVFIIYELAVNYSYNGGFSPFLDYFTGYCLNILLFYIHVYFFLKIDFMLKGRLMLLALLIILEITVYICIKYMIALTYTAFGIDRFSISNTMGFIRDSVWRAIYFIGLSSAYGYSNIANSYQKTSAVLEVQKLNAEKEKVTSELAFLKAQINPHFLFNTLGFLHYSVSRVSKEAGELIIMLSDMMRFAVSDIGDDGKIYLEDEIEHIKNYVRINEIRFKERINIALDISGDFNNIKTPPLIFLTLVENMFKYGDLSNQNCLAKIIIVKEATQLRFETYNIKLLEKRHTLNQKVGLGLKNIIGRLDKIYPESYELTILDDQISFKVSLSIKL